MIRWYATKLGAREGMWSIQTARWTFQASIQYEKDVIFLVLAVGSTDKLPLMCGNWTVNEVEESSSRLLENMMFGNSVAKSIYSPLIILSLILGGTGGRSWSVEVVKLVGIVFIIEDWFISLGGALLVWWCTGICPMGCIMEGSDNSSSPLSPRSWLLVDGNWSLVDGIWLLASTGWLFESGSWSLPTSTSLLPVGDWLVVIGIWLLWTTWLCCDGVYTINWCKRFDNWLTNCWENKLFPAGGLVSVTCCHCPFGSWGGITALLGFTDGVLWEVW